MRIFGFQFGSSKDEKDERKSFVAPNQDDGAIVIEPVGAGGFGGVYGQTVDNSTQNLTENQLIEKYREIAEHPEVDQAIEEIISDAVITDESKNPVSIPMDNLELPDKIKQKIEDAFDHVLNLLNFRIKGHDIFKRWYVDGRYSVHVVIDEQQPKKGILELRYIDPRKIKKVREVSRKVSSQTGVMIPAEVKEYWIFNENGVDTKGGAAASYAAGGIKVSNDSIAHTNSGLLSRDGKTIISHLNKAIYPANNLKMMEDSLIIYRISRSPERRIFYIDIGNLPKGRAEQYMNQIMNKHKSKLVYDVNTGEVRDDRRHLAMTEDYWIPRREGSQGTQIDTLPGAQNLGVVEDVELFRNKLYKALNVPKSRIDDDGQGLITRSSEISRDELKFGRFVARLRAKFNMLFDDLLGKQLVLTQVMTHDDWNHLKKHIHYDYIKDNMFSELFEAEVMTGRLNQMRDIDPYIGTFFSKDYVWRNILRMTDEEIEEQKKQIKKEAKGPEEESMVARTDGQEVVEEPPEEPAGGEEDKDTGLPEVPKPEIPNLEDRDPSELERSMTKLMEAMTQDMTDGEL